MTPEAINQAIASLGFNLSAAAEAIGCSRSTLSNVIRNHTQSRAIARKLAMLLGKPVSEVFPDIPRYSQPSRAEAHQAMVEAARQRLAEADHHTAKSA